MWKLKGCPRCKGDMLVQQDNHGWHECCLQCGYRVDIEDMLHLARRSKGRRH